MVEWKPAKYRVHEPMVEFVRADGDTVKKRFVANNTVKGTTVMSRLPIKPLARSERLSVTILTVTCPVLLCYSIEMM